MHELSLCSALIEEVQRVLNERPGHRVIAVELRVGPLAGVEPGLLAAAFPLASAGTPLAGAQLCIMESAVRVRCLRCALESEVPSNQLGCPRCGHWRTELTAGGELLLTRVELERCQDPAPQSLRKEMSDRHAAERSHV